MIACYDHVECNECGYLPNERKINTKKTLKQHISTTSTRFICLFHLQHFRIEIIKVFVVGRGCGLRSSKIFLGYLYQCELLLGTW